MVVHRNWKVLFGGIQIVALWAAMVTGSNAASFSLFSDRAAFLAAAALADMTVTNNDLETASSPVVVDDGAGNMVSLTVGGGSVIGAFGNPFDPSSPRLLRGQTSGGGTNLTMTNNAVSGLVTGFGFDFWCQDQRFGCTTTAEIQLNGGTETASGTVTATVAQQPSNLGFIGLLSTTAMTITSIDRIDHDGTGWSPAGSIDNIVIATVISSEPAVASTALLGLGLAAFARHRRRRAVT